MVVSRSKAETYMETIESEIEAKVMQGVFRLYAEASPIRISLGVYDDITLNPRS